MMKLFSLTSSLLLSFSVISSVFSQQFVGDVIPNSLGGVPGSEITYFRVSDPAGKNNNLTLINYSSLSNSQRLAPSQIQRVVIFVHGLNRDPGTYMSNMLSALSQTTNDPNVNFGTVQIVAPYFPNGDDKGTGYPWTAGLKPNRGSTTNCLVWSGSQWSAGANNQYPYNATTISSYEAMDQLVKYYDNRSLYPNVKQIVIAGHSLGGQYVNRYAEVGNVFTTNSPVNYWIGNPNSWAWLSPSRPLDTSSCPTYDNWREGFTNFTAYPMTYGTTLVGSGRSAILARWNSRSKTFARGTQDLGDDSTTCAPYTAGINRNERFFNFIKAFPPSCSNPTNGQCDTVDYVNAGHDAGAMMASAAGQARLFTDNFYGDGKRAYDFGYPRRQLGDDPFPDPSQNTSTITANTFVYAGNMTYAGCWTDNVRGIRSFSYQVPDNSANTVQACTAACSNAGYSMAGLEYGAQCFCGNALTGYATQTVDSGCGMTCPGNSSQICGDGNRLSVYSNGQANQLAIPGSPEVVGSYNAALCHTEATSGRALSATGYTDSNNMTLENCAAFCNGYQYFGIEYGQECYCGSYLNAGSVVAPDTDCSMLCTGSFAEVCGGPNRLNIYQLPMGVTASIVQGGSVPTATSAVVVAASSSAASSLAASSPSLCPSANGQTFAAASGKSYTITCNSDTTQGAYTGVGASNSYLDCMSQCDAQSSSNCQGFVYVGGTGGSGSGTCWLKTGIGSFVSAGSNFIAGFQSGNVGTSAATPSPSTAVASIPSVSVSCPANDGSIYTAANGTQFVVECGIDHQAGDMGSVSAQSLASCIESCASTVGCVDISYLGAACYLKSTLGAALQNSAVWGAKLYTGSAISSSVSSSISLSTIASSSVVQSVPSNPASTLITTISSSSSSVDSVSSTSTATSTTSASIYPSGVSPAGCFVDGNPRALPTQAYNNGANSAATCALACRNLGLRYSGTEYSSECWCGNYLPSNVADNSTCSMACSGDASQTCGGPNRLTVAIDTTWKQTFFARSSYSTWQLKTCYVDSSTRTLPSKLEVVGGANNMTTANCLDACTAQGLPYCGTEYYQECWGGPNAPDASLALPGDALASGCNFKCNGNSTEACGGADRLLVYYNSAIVSPS